MLAPTAVLMSLGAETGNSQQIISRKVDGPGLSFASSFEGGTAFAGAAQPQIADGLILKDVTGFRIIDSVKEMDMPAIAIASMKINTSGGGKLETELDLTDNVISTAVAKIVDANSTDGKVTMSTTGVLSDNGRPIEDAPVANQIEIPGNLLSVKDEEGTAQSLQSGKAESVKSGTPEEAAVPQVDVAGAEALTEANNGDRSATQADNEVTAEDDLNAAPAGKMTKGKDSAREIHGENAEKKERATKEEKTEKAAGAMVSALGIGAQIVTVVPIPASSVDQEYKSTKQKDVDLSSTAPAMIGRNVGPIALTDKKADQKAVSGKRDERDIKRPISALIDESAPKKSEGDVTKIAAAATSVAEDGDTKTQSKVANSAAMTSSHTGVGVSGAVAGVTLGMRPLHIAANPEATTPSFHAAAMQGEAGIQMNAGASEAVDLAHRTLTATPTTLEVGIANGSHGWLKIRAEMTGAGVVNASLSTASSSGQEMLHRELPLLTAYLHNERLAVNPVIVQPTAMGWADFRGLAGEMNGDGRGQAQQSGGQGRENRQDAARMAANRIDRGLAYIGLSGVGGDELLPLPYTGGGSWLSVRA